jgi:microcystin-dependent protein
MPYDRVEGLLVCDGATLPVNSYTALFTLLGIRFGGDPRRFAVPDLRAKAPARYNYFILPRDGTFPPRD